MKQLALILALISMVTFADAQNSAGSGERKVATRGYAEREVTPDIIYLNISLKEYYKDGNSKKKVNIETLEKELMDAALANGVLKENFRIENIYSYNSQEKKKNNELLQSRQYSLKVTDLKRLNGILEQLDSFGLANTSINGYDHSQKKTIEKELKTEAVKDARLNATILAEAEGDRVGKVFMINDNSSFSWNDMIQPRSNYAMMSKASSADAMEGAADLDIAVKPIKLTCSIEAVFELQ